MDFIKSDSRTFSSSLFELNKYTEAWRQLSADPPKITLTVLTAIFLIATATRIYSGQHKSPKCTSKDGTSTPGKIPYWFPIVGHIIPFFSNIDHLLYTARDSSTNGVFTLNLGGSPFHIMHGASLSHQLFSERVSNLDAKKITLTALHNVFGSPKYLDAYYLKIWDEMIKLYSTMLLRGPSMEKMWDVTRRNFEQTLPNLVTFSHSLVDQNLWERASNVEILSDGTLEEVSLFPLLRHCMAHLATPALLGQAIMDNHPGIVEDVFTFDRGFNWLLMGLPRWFPIRTVTRAHIARHNVLLALEDWHRAFDMYLDGKDPGFEWRDMSDVSEFYKVRVEAYRRDKLSYADRAYFDISVVWAMNANANSLVFWMIYRILSEPGLREAIRKETGRYAQVTRPPQEFPIPEPPQLEISIEGLTNDCPLFKSTYFETLRVDSQPVSYKRILNPITLVDKDNGGDPTPYIFKEGETILLFHNLHQMDPRYYAEPEKFRADRFITEKDGKKVATQGSMNPYGGGHTICKGRVFAERECLAMVAGVLALWEINPANMKKGWVHPGHVKASGVTLPKRDMRVRIRPV